MPLDERRFPTLADYARRLPAGLASYPTHVAKSSLLRTVLEEWGGGQRDDGLPEALASVMFDPPPPSAWVPEALYVGAHYAILDLDGLSDESILALTYRANRRLTESRMYAALAKVASPRILLRGASMSWGLLHRGVALAVSTRRGGARITVRHPDHLWPTMAHQSAALGFRAVLEAANGRDIVARVSATHASGADFELTWRA